MTKTIVIGEELETEGKKKIEFFKCLENCKGELKFGEIGCTPGSWNFLELVCRGYMSGVDLIFAYDFEDQRHYGVLYTGKWNDGVV